MNSPIPAETKAGVTTGAMHFYCDTDPGYTRPICGAQDPGPESGEDCPLCGLVFDEIDAGERTCPYCHENH